MKLLDPSLFFVLSILVCPVFIGTVPEGNTWTFHVPSVEDQIAHFTDPWFLGATGLLIGTLLFTHVLTPKVPGHVLSARDSRVATWFLLNGVYIHILMDGMVGAFHKWKLMDQQYKILDKRFRHDLGHEAGSCIWMVSLVELTCHGPLSIATYYAYHKNKSWRYPIEVAAATLQAMGTVMFAGSECVHGLINLPADWQYAFTLHHILYFWFAFVFCEILWLVVPVKIIYTNVKEISRAIVSLPAKTIKGKGKKGN